MSRLLPSAQHAHQGIGALLVSALISLTVVPNAEGEVRRYVWDIALPGTQAMPSWLLASPTQADTYFARQDYIITPPGFPVSDLAVTVFYDEPDDGFLRVTYGTKIGSRVLINNLYEGTGMQNQRVFVLTENEVREPFELSFKSGSREMPIWRIEWQWLEKQDVRIAADAYYEDQPELILENGTKLDSDEMPVQGKLIKDHIWHGDVITASVFPGPERIEDGVEFAFQLEDLPEMALLRVELSGQPLRHRITVWINDQAVSHLNLGLPPLFNGGYRPSGERERLHTAYVGWRSGQAAIPISALREGENTVYFELGHGEVVYPVAMRNLLLDLSYPPIAADGSLRRRAPERGNDQTRPDPDRRQEQPALVPLPLPFVDLPLPALNGKVSEEVERFAGDHGYDGNEKIFPHRNDLRMMGDLEPALHLFLND